VGGDKSFRLQGRDLVPIGQYHEIVVSSHESPMIWLGGMLHVEILEVDRLLLRKRVEDALEKIGVLVAVHPVLVGIWGDFLELETRVRVEVKPEPVFSGGYEIADEETFSGASQVEDADYFIDLARTDGADGAYGESWLAERL
jgi:hypothetical protein